VAVLWNAANAANALVMRDVEATARAAGLAIQSQQIRQPKDLDVAFAGITRDRPEGLLVVTDALLGQYQGRIVDFAKHRQLPAVSNFRDFAELGGLMSYGPNLADTYRIAASYVDRILKGTKPADLPIAQPTKFELVINLLTAKALGLEVPATLVARADEVIE
jgi:putative ABC transport system substrate-binding protein